ncbi:hypothetical protein K466DRAFT_606418 [Polyporus arcularius HHB13444]|uniref:CxC2-like cysteine cluster KDZ transposase-associated domain-containing protein n=1 Tax=Polyporus arcularius HHB13444 TaxID=1314778 RepID=A0A5C3NRS1_9APHY|nr:hypothetical protein K466DRAFT_606418 [Polyporus arcularius HHB13444]
MRNKRKDGATSSKPRKSKKLRVEMVEVSESEEELDGTGTSTTATVTVDNIDFHSNASGNRLRQRSERITVQVSQPSSAPAAASSSEAVNADEANSISAILDGMPVQEAEELAASETTHNLPGKRAKRDRPELRAANRIRHWLPARQCFLDELMCYEGCDEPIDEQETTCKTCGTRPATIRCEDCFNRPLRCKECTVVHHSEHLLHRVQSWNGTRFERTSLEAIGLKVEVGHTIPGTRCPTLTRVARRIVVCDSTGIFTHRVRFCRCLDDTGKLVPDWRQLLRLGWFPATTKRPSTVFTFRMLNTFQEVNFQGKTNLHDYWKSIQRITDNSGGVDVSDRYKQLSHVMRIWRHLVMLKRAGRAHDPAGAGATKSGELVVECPACPHPGKNLPEGWENAPPGSKWLYSLFLMIHANFRARCKDRGLDDVELAPGWAYYVEEEAYQAHVKRCRNQKEENTCSAEHNAILKANLRREGYIASGIGAVLCARHALVRKNGAGDLQLGEGYANMDYLVFSTIIGIILAALLFSYDIACQWSKKFFKRTEENFPPDMQIDRSKVEDIRFAIPKKHYRVHGGEPHSRWSLNFLKHVGPRVRCHEVYNDHWGAWNWQKAIGFGMVFLRALQEAREMSIKQYKAYEEYAAGIPAETVAQWEEMVRVWDQDPNQPDPYQEPTVAVSLADVKLQLSNEEAVEAAQGKLPPHDTTPGVFLQVGLELEDKQRALRHRANKGRSVAELADTQQKRNVLMRRIVLWQEIQIVHMPLVAQLRTQAPTNPSEGPEGSQPVIKAEDMKLWLPSALPLHLASNETVSGLRTKEARLRIAQMADALADIRRVRRVMAAISEFTRMNVAGLGQRSMTRQQGLYTRFQDKQKRSVLRYRDARVAMEKLQPSGAWTAVYRPLLDEDLRGPRRDPDEIIESEGRYEVSWIWRTQVPSTQSQIDDEHALNDDSECIEMMRAEWARCKARAERWDEEKKLLLEEMRRVIAYFEWKASWWRDQARRRQAVSARLRRGLVIYAEKQAAVFEALAGRTASFWVNELHDMGPLPAWILPYEDLARKVGPRGRTTTVAMEPEENIADGADEQDSDSDSGSDLEDEL